MRVLAVLLIFCLSVFCAEGRGLSVFMVTLPAPHSLAQSLGMADFCSRELAVCRSAPAERIAADNILNLLRMVNNRVNHAIRYVKDPAGTNVWTNNPKEGDCEDYAVTKWAQLEKAGIPLGAFSIAITKTHGEFHAVLVVTTDKGDYVLDNYHQDVVLWSSINDYTWLFRSRPGEPLVWDFIGSSSS
jgi:predicted transglutaminase-like cysteine proteinase